MKCLFPFIFLVFATTITSAQVLKGTFVTGGTIAYQSSTEEELQNFGQANLQSEFSNLEIAPAIGFTVNENLVLGAYLSYAREKRDFSFTSTIGGFEQIQGSDNNLFSIIPFLRYYKTVVDKFGLTFELNVKFGFGSGENVNSFFDNNNLEVVTNNFDVSEFSMGATPGIFYRLNDSFLIRANIGKLSYLNRTEKFSDDLNVPFQNEMRNFDLNLSDNLTLSFEYFFGGKGG